MSLLSNYSIKEVVASDIFLFFDINIPIDIVPIFASFYLYLENFNFLLFNLFYLTFFLYFFYLRLFFYLRQKDSHLNLLMDRLLKITNSRV